MELEVMVDDLSKKPEAEQQIENVARELDIKLLNDEDLKKLTVELEGGMNYGEYTNENFPY
jgi:hypothetical protein